MKTCPYCAERIQDDAIKCRYCGEFLQGRPAPMFYGAYIGYEYRSPVELMGIPLIHIAQGIDPKTGAPRIARGIIAVGNIAIGALAIGGLAFGGFALGGLSIGLVAVGGLALGGFALGGVAMAVFLAAGGLAISLAYAVGGLALAPYAIGGNRVDEGFLRILESWFAAGKQYLPMQER